MIKFAAALLSLLITATASALELTENFTPLGPTVKVIGKEGGKALY